MTGHPKFQLIKVALEENPSLTLSRVAKNFDIGFCTLTRWKEAGLIKFGTAKDSNSPWRKQNETLFNKEKHERK